MKNTNDFLHDILYYSKTQNKEPINLKELPTELLDNDLFLQYYFSNNISNSKEYALIPKHLFSNPFFVYSCLLKNPDIYLLADPSIHSDLAFSKLKSLYPENYLKYASEEQLNNEELCLEAAELRLSNFKYFPKHFKEDYNICFKVAYKFSKNQYSSIDIDKYIAFTKEIPTSLKDNNLFVEKLLSINPLFFSGLTKTTLSDPKIAQHVILKNSKLFKYAAPYISENEELIKFFLKNNESKSDAFNQNIFFSRNNIIEYLPINYFTPEFCKEYEKNIQEVFTFLPKSHRENINIIKANYVNSKYSYLMYGKTYINKNIMNAPLKTALIDFISKFNNKEDAHKNMETFFDHFILDMEISHQNSKKNKPLNKI